MPEIKNKKTLILSTAFAICLLSAIIITFLCLDKREAALTPGIEAWESRYLMYSDGWYINERIFNEHGLNAEDADEPTEILYGPFIHLDRGTYYVKVDYETFFDQSIRVYCFEKEDEIILEEATKLPYEGRTVCYAFQVTDDLDNFEIRICYNGRGTLKIKDIAVYGRSWGRMYHIRNLCLALALLLLIPVIVSARPGLYRIPLGDNTPGRELWIDLARGIGIISVFLGHSIGNPFYWLIYGFHMPLFFILSGYLFKKERVGSYSIKLLKRYIVPYLMLCFGNSLLRIPYMMVGEYTLSGIRNGLAAYWIGSLKGAWREMPNCMPLWFLPAIAVSLLLFRIIKQIPFVPVRIILYMLCAFVGYNWKLYANYGIPSELPLGLHTIMTDVAFIAVGHGLSMLETAYKDRCSGAIMKHGCVIALAMLLPGLACIVINRKFYHDLDIYYNKYGNFILTYAGAILVSTSIMLLCRRINSRLGNGNIVAVIGFNSMFFFAFDFWGRTLATNYPRILDYESWIVVFFLKFIFVGLLFAVWRQVKALLLIPMKYAKVMRNAE